jgi:hypothetical protein
MPVDSTSKIVFCEGKPDSLDYLLLTQILPLGSVRIQPVDGKFGLQAYIRGYLATYPDNAQPVYVAFRDRDFDAEPPETPQLIPLKEPLLWMSYRAAVENYLIDADMLHRYWAERERTPEWKHGPAPSTDAIEKSIRRSAQELADYQAVRWGLARLRPGARWPEIRTTWTRDGSGNLPLSLAYDDCLAEASQLASSFQDQIQNIHPDHLQTYANIYRERFHSQGFLDTRGYLVWFHGKDYLVHLCRRLTPDFPRKSYANWAAECVDVQRHPELQQLVGLAD